MADPITNTYTVSTGGSEESVIPGHSQGVREDLHDVISRIDPTEVPFYSMAKKGTHQNIQFDWLVQELIAPNTDNAGPEGFEAAFEALKKPDRFINIAQIMRKAWLVSGTMDVVNKAGRAREFQYQQVMKGLEIRRDLETTLLMDQTRVLTPEPRRFSSVPTWFNNASVGAGAGVPATGDGSDAHTPGTSRPLTLDLIDDALEIAYNRGGAPKNMFMSPSIRRKFSKLPGVNVNQTNLGGKPTPALTIGTVSIYLSDFGELDVVMNRWMPTERIYIFDPRYIEIPTLPGRSFFNKPLAATGDATKGLIIWEGSLRVLAPKAHAVVHDLNLNDPA